MKVSGIKAQEPFSGETIVLEDEGSEKIAKKIIMKSRTNYAINHAAESAKIRKTTKNAIAQKKSARRPGDSP